MFTSNQGDLSVHYYDSESGRIRQYYPDFLAKMTDGSYQLIEVKGDNKIDDTVVKAKKRLLPLFYREHIGKTGVWNYIYTAFLSRWQIVCELRRPTHQQNCYQE